MFSILYDGALLLLLIVTAPKWLWQWVYLKKYRGNLKARILCTLPPLSRSLSHPVIWIHAVSVGETRAAIPLYKKIKTEMPHASILISSTTETGHKEAQRSLPDAEAHFFLPLDFSWNIKKVVKTYQPDLLILMEGEFWYHLLAETQKSGARILLANGALSARSSKRFQQFSFFTKRLFPLIDYFCVQSELIKQRFLSLNIAPEKICVTGNLKLDYSPLLLTSSQKERWKKELGITPEDRVIVIGSTHENEESMLLQALEQVWEKEPHLKVILVPRHIERCPAISKDLLSKKARYRERVILIDKMGVLHSSYQLAEIAIVAGSFTDKVGGHNIFEPITCTIPVLFGPYMFSQLALRTLALDAEAALEVDLDRIAPTLIALLGDKALTDKIKENAAKLSSQVHGSTKRSWEALFPFFLNQP